MISFLPILMYIVIHVHVARSFDINENENYDIRTETMAHSYVYEMIRSEMKRDRENIQDMIRVEIAKERRDIIRNVVAEEVGKYKEEIHRLQRRVNELEAFGIMQGELVSKCRCKNEDDNTMEVDSTQKAEADGKERPDDGTIEKHSSSTSEMSDKKPSWSNKIKRNNYGIIPFEPNTKRILLDGIPGGDMTAFYAYMSHGDSSPPQHHTLIFDTVITNLGNAYNQHDGVFTAPNTGYYVFTWTIVTGYRSYIYSEIIINSSPIGSSLTNSEDINDEHTVTGIVVAHVNQGDVIHIKTNGVKGQMLSLSNKRSSFSGWRIF